LPGTPKIFHGRETALESLVSMLLLTPARVAILGAGGIGKTSLSIALLWDPRIIGAFPDRYFVSCESIHTAQDMLVALVLHLDIPPSNHLMKSILRFFSDRGPTMIVLDNLETAWESIEQSRRGIEEFLGQLTEIHHVALVVTMRGVERPGGVRWTRPFLPPLDLLDSTAARKIYVDIADEPIDKDEDAQVQELLSFTDNLPLAITLLANIASFEGVSVTLNRYRLETTAMLSEGYDKRSNLHKSIMLSLGSWRLRAVPDATTLLAVLSLLPDGISPSQLYRCGTDIEEIGRCKSTLIRTSLAFLRPNGRLSVLTPIREYMQKFQPASRDTVKPWKAYLGDLLLDWASQRDLVSTQLADSITANLGNIRSLVHYSLSDDDTTMRGIGYDILRLDAFLYDIYGGSTDLFSFLQEIIDKTGDATLEGLRICGLLERHIPKIHQSDAEALVSRGLHLFRTTFDPVGEGITFIRNCRTTLGADFRIHSSVI
ncbi:hypothetical protein DFH09DRAFT_900077, partial [Mycena vulgaris]